MADKTPSPALPGLSHVPSYQKSGKPYASANINCSTLTRVQFPAVTKFFQLSNTGATPCRFGFSSAGVSGSGTNYSLVAPSGTTPIYELATAELWLSGSNGIYILAGLTNIPVSSLSGNYTGSQGIG